MAAIQYNWTKTRIFNNTVPLDRVDHSEAENQIAQLEADEQHRTELIDIARRIYQRARLQRRYRRPGSIF